MRSFTEMILKKNGVHLISVMEPIAEDKFYHLDPLTAPLVLEAFQRYDNGESGTSATGRTYYY